MKEFIKKLEDNGFTYKSYENDDIVIVNGDCLKVMGLMEDNSVDLVLTDPPYGIGIDGQKESKSKNPKHNRKEHKQKDWDYCIPEKMVFDNINRISINQVICGANYFNEYLRQGYKGWIVWDKGQHGLTMSDCELIYTSFNSPTRVIIMNRVELMKDGTEHPTQKPLKLFQKILDMHSKENDLIFDGFLGSGTTALACLKTERRCIGVELDEDYYKIACERIEKQLQSPTLFGGF